MTAFKSSTANRSYNADNQLTNSGFTYDGNGSPTTYATKALTYDPEQRLTSYSGTVQTNGYDGDGLRAWKQKGAATTRTYFLYDGALPVCEFNSAGGLSATNTFGADDLVSRHVGLATTLYAFDERGNVSQRLSSTGAVTSSDLYDGYGARTSTAAVQPDPFGYGGQFGYYTDTETGLLLCTHRYYDPAAGRFVTRDPIGYDGGINLYGYVGNDPANRNDSSGYHPGGESPSDLHTPSGLPDGYIEGMPAGWPQPPKNIPGGPWNFSKDNNNSRAGVLRGPKGPGRVGAHKLTYNCRERQWKLNRPNPSGRGPDTQQRYDDNGNEIDLKDAHPWRAPKSGGGRTGGGGNTTEENPSGMGEMNDAGEPSPIDGLDIFDW